MRIVVSDTGPINYLVLIDYIDILPALFEKIILPSAVKEELTDPHTPHRVREWMNSPPPWLEVRERPQPSTQDDILRHLGEGEREAIDLAMALDADLLLMDDREGVKIALGKGLETTGTLGVLDEASRRGLIDLADAFVRLRDTTFRYPANLMGKLLANQRRKGGPSAI